MWYKSFTKARVKRRTWPEPSPIQPIRLIQGSAFDPIQFGWFCLERLSCSSRLTRHEKKPKTDSGSNGDLHMKRTKRILTLPLWTTEQGRFCHLFGVAIGFNWIKFEFWLKKCELLIIWVDPNCHWVRLMSSMAFDPGLRSSNSWFSKL